MNEVYAAFEPESTACFEDIGPAAARMPPPGGIPRGSSAGLGTGTGAMREGAGARPRQLVATPESLLGLRTGPGGLAQVDWPGNNLPIIRGFEPGPDT